MRMRHGRDPRGTEAHLILVWNSIAAIFPAPYGHRDGLTGRLAIFSQSRREPHPYWAPVPVAAEPIVTCGVDPPEMRDTPMKTTVIALLVVGQLTLLPVVAALTHNWPAGTVASTGDSIQARNVTVIYKHTGYKITGSRLTTDPWPNSKPRPS